MSEFAGLPATVLHPVDLDRLRTAYYSTVPDVEEPGQRIAFGTSGHRGSALTGSFNEAHIIAVCLAVAEYRAGQGWTGPLFLGGDTHPLSEYALDTACKTLLCCGVTVFTSLDAEYVPTPALSHAILTYNRGRDSALADGIIVTPSHNPPVDGGIKYNPPHGGPADTAVTKTIEARANYCLEKLVHVPDLAAAVTALLPELRLHGAQPGTVTEYDFLGNYVADLEQVIDIAAIRNAGLRFAAHPLGGAATAYWQRIADEYSLDLVTLGPGVDKTWSFMTLDWDGKIRMDPSSPHVMRAVVEMSDGYRLVVANDADADRHGIVTADAGLMNPNHFLAVCIDYLLRHRPQWQSAPQVGKTIVSSALLDRVIAAAGADMVEVPVGFKWFVPDLHSGTMVFGGEESAGASMVTRAGEPWSTDKDGIVLGLLAAEILAVTGKTPSQYYSELAAEHGTSSYQRVDAPASPAQKQRLLSLTAADITVAELAGDSIIEVLTHAPGNGAAIGGLVIRTARSWIAIRPSGTEAVLKVYAESFGGADHLQQLLRAAEELLRQLLQTEENSASL